MASKTASEHTGYSSLLLKYSPRPIRSERHYQQVLQQIDQLMHREKLTPAEEDLLELLATLVAQYEEQHYPAEDVPPGELVAHYLEVRGMTKADLARATGIPRQTITNIANGSRNVSQANRTKLADYFCVSPELFRAN